MLRLKLLPIFIQKLFESSLRLLAINCATPNGENKITIEGKTKINVRQQCRMSLKQSNQRANKKQFGFLVVKQKGSTNINKAEEIPNGRQRSNAQAQAIGGGEGGKKGN